MSDSSGDSINVQDLPQMDIAPTEYERYTVLPGDLLVCEGGEVGRAAIWSGELPVIGFQKALHRLRPINIEADLPRFLFFALYSAVKRDAFNDGHISTIAHLTGEKLRGARFQFPPLREQAAIVRELDCMLAATERAVKTAEREISLLHEYRTRLIADVVTGKLDVREAAARLPEGPDEQDSDELAYSEAIDILDQEPEVEEV